MLGHLAEELLRLLPVVADFINWVKRPRIRVGPGRAPARLHRGVRVAHHRPVRWAACSSSGSSTRAAVDADFGHRLRRRRRGEVIAYVTDKYGADKVAQIATFVGSKARRDQGRPPACSTMASPSATGSPRALPADVMGGRLVEGPSTSSTSATAGQRVPFAARLRGRCPHDLSDGRGSGGQIRNWGVHAAGVIISSDPLIDIVPIMARPQDGAIITQFDYPMWRVAGWSRWTPGSVQPAHPGRRAGNIEVNRDQQIVLRTCPSMTGATYELMVVARRSGVPARWWRHAFVAALAAPRQLLRTWSRSALSPPRVRGGGLPQQVRTPQNGREAIEPIHPALPEALEPVSWRDLRPDRLPGAG